MHALPKKYLLTYFIISESKWSQTKLLVGGGRPHGANRKGIVWETGST